MPALQKKSNYVEMQLYYRLPDTIKEILGGPDNVDITTQLMKTAGLSEDFRPYINTVVFGLFVGELNPIQLVEAVKEWLAVDEVKAQLVASLIKKTFIEPHIDFLTKLYNPAAASAKPSIPPGNVVNLKSTYDQRLTTNDKKQ